MTRYRSYGSSDGSYVVLLVIFTILVLVFGCGRGVWVNKDVAVRTLESQGYTEIQVTDHSWFAIGWRGCDEKDAARFTARAKNPAGKEVTVYVCSGLLKGETIRTP